MAWLLENSLWIGFPAMAIMGGSLSHVLAYEEAEVLWTVRKHFLCLGVAWTKGLFIAAIIYWLQQEYKWSLPLCFVFTGLLSIFGTDTIKKMRDLAYQKFFGQTEVKKDGKRKPN